MKNKTAGFSLVELLIAVGIGGAITLGIASVLMTAFTQSSLITDSAESEIDEMRAMNFIQNIFSQAINVKFHGATDLNGYTGIDGRIREFDSDLLWADATHSAYPLAVFWREGMNSTDQPLAGKTSVLKRTAIYFQKPRAPAAGARSTWGVIYVNLGAGVTPLGATRSDQIFEGFTRMRILNVTTFDADNAFPTSGGLPNVGAPVTSFDLELTFRRFIGHNQSNDRSFCPQAYATDCPADNMSYKDIVRVSKVTLRNNIIGPSPSGGWISITGASRPYGARLFDLIHFFHPLMPETSR